MTHAEAIALYNELSGVMGLTPTPDDAKDKIRRLYEYVTGDKLRRCNCQDLYNDALILITLKIYKMENRKYKLKRGVVIQVPGTTDVYTHVNLTDDVAKAYLEKYPNKVKLFDAIPEEQSEEQPEEQPLETEDATTAKQSETKPKRARKK